MMEETNGTRKMGASNGEEVPANGSGRTEKKAAELKEEGDWLTVCHFGRRLGVHKENGKIIAMEDHDPVTCYEGWLNITCTVCICITWPITKMTG